MTPHGDTDCKAAEVENLIQGRVCDRCLHLCIDTCGYNFNDPYPTEPPDNRYYCGLMGGRSSGAAEVIEPGQETCPLWGPR